MYQKTFTLTAAATLAALLSACAVGPDYKTPAMTLPQSYKEAQNWTAAQPADHADRGAWWQPFGDAKLNELAARIAIANNNVAASQAAYDQARALVRQQRASLFPSINLNASNTRTHTEGTRSTVVGGVTTNGGGTRSTYQANLGASWEPDVWGRLRRGVENAQASEQASAADLASAKLSAQGELVTNYLSLRETDAELALLQSTVEGYDRALQIAQNRYKAGIAQRSDVLQAQTQLYGTQADLEGLKQTRAQLEHAIAVLLGQAPADFTLAVEPWNGTVPQVPLAVPSTLLQRRPDIAAAERRVAAANAQVGVAQSAWFPSFSLSASYGSTSSSLSELFDASTLLWSLGLSASQTLLDFGSRKAQVAQARAAYEQSAATYRQTVLAAFQDVEDQLSAARVLERQFELRQQASAVADESERLMLNQYRAGQVGYADVVTAQASALSARRSLVQVALNRQTSAVALIQALGGGWDVSQAAVTSND